MSSEEEGSPPLKSKRQIRSCDFCRQRKIRCNNPDANGKCANCVAYGAPCTHIRPRRKRGPKNKTLEEFRQQIATLEAKLRSLSVCALCAQLLQSRPDSDRRSSPSVFQHSTPESSTASTDAGRPPAEEDVSQDELVGRFRQLAVATGGLKGQFFGSSSSFALVSSALAVKEKYLGRPATAARHARRMVYYETPPVSSFHLTRHQLMRR
ncbi:hypothetical protein DFH07DRAFT_179102 [Mycena maculata]|uniref:Zn(2)-C6 fungal-type domain-containing protein n=1 Tax=Mycena maculata TaxID=230809 RepID=A0AAD7HW40_9AGAR|nr:hypothetical protein DFH07DRAFT_179102 [Mycena maculata]